MKVLFVDQTGELGGGELSLLDIVKNTSHTAEVALFSDGPFRHALEDAGIRVHLLDLGRAGEVRREGGLASLLAAGPALLRFRSRFRSLAGRFDVLYANSQKAFLLSAITRRRGQPLVWHLRDMLDAQHFSATMRRIAVAAGNRAASKVVANSRATLESFVHAGGRRDKSVVVYNGVEPGAFDSVPEAEVLDARDRLGLRDKYVIGAFGRLTPWKGQQVLVDALGGLPDVDAVIVGEALFGEDVYAQALKESVVAQGLADRVHFLGFRRDIPRLMRMVDVVVHTSTAPEPFGRVLVEGMLATRPVIATRAGGALEIIADRRTGLLVTAGSVAELGDAVRALRSDPDLARRIAEDGREHALKFFSVQSMVRGVDSVLELLSSDRAEL